MVPLYAALVILVALPGCPYCPEGMAPIDTEVQRETALDQAFHSELHVAELLIAQVAC